MKKNRIVSTEYVDVLDGLRALSVILVLVFHFWQQTWIFPVVKLPFLSFIGITQIDFTSFARTGYIFVDMMILISGFLLFLPVARNVVVCEPLENWGVYFRKRSARILPSYFLCIITVFLYELSTHGYGIPTDWHRALKDLLLHSVFLHTWTLDSYLNSKLNTVLWTLGVEVWFYILFPVIASFIKRRKSEKHCAFSVLRAVIMMAVMIAVSLVYIYMFVLNKDSAAVQNIDAFIVSHKLGFSASYTAMVINQLPAFFATYAIGMMGSIIYVFAAKRIKRRWWISFIATALSVLVIWAIVRKVDTLAHLQMDEAQQWQVRMRIPLSCLFMLLILFASFSAGWFRFLFSNPLMRFLSAISYNLYIWHQWLAVKIKNDWRIPYWTGDDPPNQWGTPEGRAWSNKYALIITIAAFATAILITYLFERPIANAINGKKRKRK